jgi:hypothetical protein
MNNGGCVERLRRAVCVHDINYPLGLGDAPHRRVVRSEADAGPLGACARPNIATQIPATDVMSHRRGKLKHTKMAGEDMRRN